MEFSELEKRFTLHAPKDSAQMQKCESICKNSLYLAQLLNTYSPDSREKSLAITALEEFMKRATDSIIINT